MSIDQVITIVERWGQWFATLAPSQAAVVIAAAVALAVIWAVVLRR